MKGEQQCSNNFSGNSLFKIPSKAYWEESLQHGPPGGTGMFHHDSPWQLISSTQEAISPFQQPS